MRKRRKKKRRIDKRPEPEETIVKKEYKCERRIKFRRIERNLKNNVQKNKAERKEEENRSEQHDQEGERKCRTLQNVSQGEQVKRKSGKREEEKEEKMLPI